jgi:hypothetical protein
VPLPPSVELTQSITTGTAWFKDLSQETPERIARLTQQFERCKAQLLQLSWISQGSVFQTQNGTWCWTRKVKTKTVTVALSAQQAELFEQAIAQQRKLTALLAKMRDISQTFLLQSVPGPLRRKRFQTGVLAINKYTGNRRP